MPSHRVTRMRALALAAALVIPGVAEAQAPGTLLAADAAAARAAASSGLPAALRGALSRGGVVLWPGAPVVSGAEAIALVGASTGLDSLRVSWQPVAAVTSNDSTLGLTWGVLVGASRADAEAPRFGRYIAAWRREADGWKVAALMMSGLLPPAAARVPAGMALESPPLPARGEAAAFIAADLAFASLAADSGADVAFARWAADEAEIQTAGGIVRGPAAIGALVAGPADWMWAPVAAGASRDGSLGWTVGQSVVTPRGGEPSHGKYLTVWRRLQDGRVRYLTDGGNARPAPR